MSVVQVITPPLYATANFEMAYAGGLGLVVICKTCDIAVLTWDPDHLRWCDPEDRPIPTYTVRCWGCGSLLHRPGTHIVRRFKELNG